MSHIYTGAKLYEMKVKGLEGRFFGGVTDKDVEGTSSSSGGGPSSGVSDDRKHKDKEVEHASYTSGAASSDGRGEMQTAVGEGMMF